MQVVSTGFFPDLSCRLCVSCSGPCLRAVSELSPVLRHDYPALKGNESCSSFQGRGVGVMRFLPCVSVDCVEASADVPAFCMCPILLYFYKADLRVMQIGNI